MWRPTLRKSKVGEDLLEFLKQQSEKNTGSLQSGDILTVHLEVVSDSTLSTLGGILELCNITLFPDTCLDLFCISLSMRKSFRKGECHVYSWEKSGFCKLPEKIFSEKKYINSQPLCRKAMALLKSWWMTLFQNFQDEKTLSAPPRADEWQSSPTCWGANMENPQGGREWWSL